MAGSKYRESGVDIDAANRAKKKIAALARETWGPEVLSEIGNFGGLFAMSRGLRRSPCSSRASTASGRSSRWPSSRGKHDTVGEDLVNHCVNDILVQGAEPLFFLDYIASGVLDPAIVTDVIEGIARGCSGERLRAHRRRDGRDAGILRGGGVRSRRMHRRRRRPRRSSSTGARYGREIRSGPSRRAASTRTATRSRERSFSRRRSSRSTTSSPARGRASARRSSPCTGATFPRSGISRARAEIKGLAHITGGGLLENIPRILPAARAVEIDVSTWETPPLFRYLKERGGVDWMEMHRVFNMGIGMVVIVASEHDGAMRSGKYRWKPFPIGRVVAGDRAVHLKNVPAR